MLPLYTPISLGTRHFEYFGGWHRGITESTFHLPVRFRAHARIVCCPLSGVDGGVAAVDSTGMHVSSACMYP
jgi:hypothetical protein